MKDNLNFISPTKIAIRAMELTDNLQRKSLMPMSLFLVLIISLIHSDSLADWVSIEYDETFDFGLYQEWNLPALKDDHYSILMTKHKFVIDKLGAWKPVWEWCNEEFRNRCTPSNSKWIANYITIYKIDCFAPAKKFQIINNYWIGDKGDELHWNMGVDPEGGWVQIINGDLLETRLKKHQVCLE